MAKESLGATPEELRRARGKYLGWGGVTGALFLAAIFSLVFGFLPAAKEYRAIKEKLCVQVVHPDGGREAPECHERQLNQEQLSALGALIGVPEANALVTTAGKTYTRDLFVTSTEKFHAIGTGTNAAAAGDTTLQTELTTQYNPDNTRATGSQTNNGSAVYRTVGTNTVDSGVAITEWGLLSQAATGGGTLFSRIVFSAINLSSGDSLQTTYDLTIS
jgi:hypothetical protein